MKCKELFGESIHVGQAMEKWHCEFSFIKETNCYHAYLAMLGLATSANHLERLFQMLPPNRRLLRHDWERVKDFWRYYFNGEVADRCRGKLIKWLLEEQSVDWKSSTNQDETPFRDMRPYYVSKIRQSARSKTNHFTSHSNWNDGAIRILSCPERAGNGYEHFEARLFGTLLDMGFQISADKSQIQARFLLKEKELTDELAYKIICKLPAYYVPRYSFFPAGYSTKYGQYLNVCFDLVTGALSEHLYELEKAYGKPMVATSDYCSVVADRLREKGIPVEGDLIPITS